MGATTHLLPPAGADPVITRRLIGFVRLLRDNGFRIGAGEAADGLVLARQAGALDARGLREGWRALLCASERDL